VKAYKFEKLILDWNIATVITKVPFGWVTLQMQLAIYIWGGLIFSHVLFDKGIWYIFAFWLRQLGAEQLNLYCWVLNKWQFLP
jgi:hypothetical protein